MLYNNWVIEDQFINKSSPYHLLIYNWETCSGNLPESIEGSGNTEPTKFKKRAVIIIFNKKVSFSQIFSWNTIGGNQQNQNKQVQYSNEFKPLEAF